jgi:hypothetical protein
MNPTDKEGEVICAKLCKPAMPGPGAQVQGSGEGSMGFRGQVSDRGPRSNVCWIPRADHLKMMLYQNQASLDLQRHDSSEQQMQMQMAAGAGADADADAGADAGAGSSTHPRWA